MAKTKMEKENMETPIVETTEKTAEPKEEKIEKATSSKNTVATEDNTTERSGPSYDELVSLVQQLANEITTLKSGNTASPKTEDGLANILSTLANRKSDREVSIVHNQELNGGLTTHIELNNTIIDFKHIGETRLLSWQQFEECVSKYRSFFDRRIILVDSAYAEVADQYGLPCNEGKTHTLTQKDIANIAKLSVTELENFIEKLNEEDKDTIFSFWLGKCYSREKGYYDRHKMDTLNRLSNGMFGNILLVMNGEDRGTSTEQD